MWQPEHVPGLLSFATSCWPSLAVVATLPALPDNHSPLLCPVKFVSMLVLYFLFPNLDGSRSHFSIKMLKRFLKISKQEET